MPGSSFSTGENKPADKGESNVVVSLIYTPRKKVGSSSEESTCPIFCSLFSFFLFFFFLIYTHVAERESFFRISSFSGASRV